MLNDFGGSDGAKLERHFEPEPSCLPGKEPRREQIARAGRIDQPFDRLGGHACALVARHRDRAFLGTRDHQGRDLWRDRGDGGVEVGLTR